MTVSLDTPVREDGVVKASTFAIGDPVEKTGGDYSYRGGVVGVIRKRSGALRYVVENSDGMLFIFNESQLRPWGQSS